MFDSSIEFALFNYSFETPRGVESIIRHILDNYEYHPRKIPEFYQQMIRKLSRHEQRDLETKYPSYVFYSIKNVPQEYPPYAYRNVYIKTWRSLDIGHLFNYYEFKNNKIKYLESQSVKQLTLNDKWQMTGDFKWRDYKLIKTSSKHKKYQNFTQQIEDELDQIDID